MSWSTFQLAASPPWAAEEEVSSQVLVDLKQ